MNLSSVITLATECLEDAKENYSLNRARVCIGRSYYCFFHCIQALLASQNVFVKSHSGNLNKFNELFIKNGMIDKQYSVWAGKLFEERMDADYDAECTFDDKTQKEALEHAEEFLKITKEYLISQNLIQP